MLSVANLCSEMGYERFSKQKQFKVAGFYFMSPDQITMLVKKAGFCVKIMKHEAEGEGENMYYKRDICVLI